MFRFVFLVLSLLIPALSFAEAEKGAAPLLETANSDYTAATSWSSVILVLCGILFFIVLLGWAARRFGGMSAMGVRDMRVISAIPVGTRERVVLVDVKGQQFLLGITAQNINHLHTFDEPVISPQEGGDFASKLQKLMKDARGTSVPNAYGADTTDQSSAGFESQSTHSTEPQTGKGQQ